MSPVGLGDLLAKLPRNEDPNLLVGYETNDDAGIYRLTDDLAIINTADFITPPVADPYRYGQIAAANAISDVYAMGGRPVTCLNLVAFPSGKLPMQELHEIIAGALNVITASGAVLAGGHSIDDDEPKFGLAVTGVVHPEHYWTNSGARPEDVLILTKPLGSGVLFNANLKNLVSGDAMEACIQSLIFLNRKAAEVLRPFDVHAVTDVTGFGLAGHGLEMAQGSEVQIRLALESLPTFAEALKMYRRGVTTGVNAFNRSLTQDHLRWSVEAPAWQEEILFDPQTSGGLLAAVAAHQAPEILTKLHESGIPQACRVGTVHPHQEGQPFLQIS